MNLQHPILVVQPDFGREKIEKYKTKIIYLNLGFGVPTYLSSQANLQRFANSIDQDGQFFCSGLDIALAINRTKFKLLF